MTYTLLPAGIGKQMPHKFQRLPERVSGLVEVTETEGSYPGMNYVTTPKYFDVYVDNTNTDGALVFMDNNLRQGFTGNIII